MGGDIAAWCAGQDIRVTLADMKPEPIAGAIKRASDLFGKIMRKRTDIRDALDRLMPDMDGEGVRNADLIIEAVPEKLELKQKVYAGLEPRMKPGAILATNTSSIPLQDLRTSCKGRSGWSACISSIRYRGCNWSKWSAMTAPTRRC